VLPLTYEARALRTSTDYAYGTRIRYPLGTYKYKSIFIWLIRSGGGYGKNMQVVEK
jgi:hypothetical protein